MSDLKAEFLAYLRSVYSGEPMQMADVSLPPLNVGPNYPAFTSSVLNDGLGMMVGAGSRVQPGMGLQAAFAPPSFGGMGMQQGVGMQPGMGMQPQGGVPPEMLMR